MRHSLLALVLALGAATTASAEFNYNFVSASYGRIDIDDADVDGDAFGVGLSLAISENFHAFGGAEFANFNVDVDSTAWALGAGYNTPLSEVIDVVAQLSYQRVEFDTPVGSADDDGIGIGVGLRIAASERFEISGGVTRVEFDQGGGNTAFGAGFLFNATENFAVGVGASFDDDVTSYDLGGRFYF